MIDTSQGSVLQMDEEDKVAMLARYAVAMQLEANKKVGKICRVVTIVAILAAVLLKSFWPLVVGIALCVLVFLYVINSCISFVEKHTGMPQEVQAMFSRQYKSDPQFAKEVDEFHRDGMAAADYLRNNPPAK